MYAVLLETCTEKGFIAIAKEGEILFEVLLTSALQHAQQILPELQRGLRELGLSLNNIDYIALGTGPGSYTGIRVGAIVAKVLNFALDIPLISISTLNLFIGKDEGDYVALIDAKIGGVYFQLGEITSGEVIYKSQPLAVSLREALPYLDRVSTVVTPHAAQLKSKFPKKESREWCEAFPSSKHLLKLSLRKFLDKDFVVNGGLELAYMRKTQAEIEKENEIKKVLSLD